MSLITRMRRQYLVFWPKTGTDAYGKPTYGAPQELKCRWDDEAKEFWDPKGNKLTSRSIAYPEAETPPGSVLWLGRLDNVPTEFQFANINPTKLANAYPVLGFAKIPNLRAKEFLLVAYM